uniref:Uncharacterized protein n=1 Tax=Timema shepardi TaxID=629360 RepID=A0A7R9ALQ1_TIMSH|nr:unnamed protein product [Timema shepardi]
MTSLVLTDSSQLTSDIQHLADDEQATALERDFGSDTYPLARSIGYDSELKVNGSIPSTFKLGLLLSLLHPSVVNFSDHPVHAPASKGNPWECDFLEDKGYFFSPVNGVFHVYKDQESLGRNEAFNYQYPNLASFVTDMNTLCVMMADGPL